MKKGILRFIYRELCSLEDKGHEIFIFPTKLKKGTYQPRDSWRICFYNKLIVVLLQPILFLRRPGKYFRLLIESLRFGSFIHFLIGSYYAYKAEKLKIDLIHCHFGDHKLFIGYFIKRYINLPLTVTIHAHEIHRNPNPEMFKRALGFCNKIITISDYNKKYLINNFGVIESRIQTIRLFVDEPEKKKNKVLVVGSFEERKGYDVLLRSIRDLKDEDCEFWIVGEGDMDIRDLASKYGVQNKIKFMGHLHSNVLDILFESCDIFCLPSKTVEVSGGVDAEGIPVVLMEAMSHGKPIVTTKHVGIPELVEEILVEEDNHIQLTKALKELFYHPERHKEMGRRNLAKIRKDYSPNNLDELESLFRNIG